MTPEQRVDEALSSQSDAQRVIAVTGLSLVATLLKKNHDYGSSAWDSPVLCPRLSPGDALLCRMSDKIKRLQTLLSGESALVEESIEDTIQDLAGYCLLWLSRPETDHSSR